MPKEGKRRRGRPCGSGRELPDFPPPRRFGGEEVLVLRRRLIYHTSIPADILPRSDLAAVLGVSRSLIHAWEQEKQRPSRVACRLMECLWESPEFALSLMTRRGRLRKKLEAVAASSRDEE